MTMLPFLWITTAPVRSAQVLKYKGWQPPRSSSVLTASYPLCCSFQRNRKCHVPVSDSMSRALTESASARFLRQQLHNMLTDHPRLLSASSVPSAMSISASGLW